MDVSTLLALISGGENSKVQFKEDITNALSIAQEMVAFANSYGGIIIIGINDKTGEVAGLDFQSIQRINNLLATAANELVKNPIYVFSETLDIEGKKVIIAHIKEGTYKPYRDKDGIIWVKNASDKRKVVSNEEDARLLQSGGSLFADEMLVSETSILDLDIGKVKKYFDKQFGKEIEESGLALAQVLKNMRITKNDQLTLAGLLVFGRNPSFFKPTFVVKAVSFFGNEMSGIHYRDSKDFEGDIAELYESAMRFVSRNIHYLQNQQNFNSEGLPEIPLLVFEELIQNALIHRDYFKNSPVRLLIFDNRIEIISPGRLPNSLTVESIKLGNSTIRNPLLASYAAKILPYRGLGSGIIRALKAYPFIDFWNDIEGEQFKVILQRQIT